ncbi:glucan endo-1,3-beta-glucosidase 8-like [Henckelia pumila]|uniref:glucan endo-1,3-beta-glucosidase 8-like n=1 Tax=Henckelia pumila TaxID=405737 RepID=UPI003C6E563D
METNFQTFRCTEEQKMETLGYLLEGRARKWWRFTSAPFFTARGVATWAEFRTDFQKLYFPSALCQAKADAFIGINWGRLSSQKLVPSMVVDLLLQNGIQDVRIFQQAENVLEAFYGSGISATLGLANTLLQDYVNETRLNGWIKDKIIKYQDVMTFRYVTVGTNPFSPAFQGKIFFDAVQVVRNMQRQLNLLSVSEIKATIPNYIDVITFSNTLRPSEADFRDDIKEKMVEYVTILNENKAPFFLSMYPIHFVINNSLDFDFAFMDNKSSYSINDTNAKKYTNVFELLYDSCHWALAKANASQVKIVIGAIGWPTDSYPGANVTSAERFYKSFLPYIYSGRGTPMRPDEEIDIFINNLSDENRMTIQLGGFQRHWGIYKFNGEPKYAIDFSGHGRYVVPSKAKGVTSMPNRWCVFNGNMDDPKRVQFLRTMACNVTDCSSLDDGGSCSNLTYTDKISYAFNRYFQAQGQSSETSEEECYMGGLGKVVSENPSNGKCVFPVEILSAEYAVQGATFGEDSGGERVQYDRMISASVGLVAFTVFWIIGSACNL